MFGRREDLTAAVIRSVHQDLLIELRESRRFLEALLKVEAEGLAIAQRAEKRSEEEIKRRSADKANTSAPPTGSGPQAPEERVTLGGEAPPPLIRIYGCGFSQLWPVTERIPDGWSADRPVGTWITDGKRTFRTAYWADEIPEGWRFASPHEPPKASVTTDLPAMPVKEEPKPEPRLPRVGTFMGKPIEEMDKAGLLDVIHHQGRLIATMQQDQAREREVRRAARRA